MSNESKCPVMGHSHAGTVANQRWWPNQLNLKVLHQNPPAGDPMGEDFNYAEEFKTVDLEELQQDIEKVMTTSQEWWPADYGHYGPSSFGWRGTVQARIASTMAAAAQPPARCVSHPSTVGPTTRASTRRAGCYGRSSRSTDGSSRGRT